MNLPVQFLASNPEPLFAPVVALVILLVALVFLVFWIWVLIDCIKNEPAEGNEKLIWVIVIALTGWLGALVYFFARRGTRIRQTGR